MIMPPPPFDPKKKNKAVKFPPFGPAVALHSTGKVMKGVDRTVYTNKLK